MADFIIGHMTFEDEAAFGHMMIQYPETEVEGVLEADEQRFFDISEVRAMAVGEVITTKQAA